MHDLLLGILLRGCPLFANSCPHPDHSSLRHAVRSSFSLLPGHLKHAVRPRKFVLVKLFEEAFRIIVGIEGVSDIDWSDVCRCQQCGAPCSYLCITYLVDGFRDKA
jgi:hypothetical protein